MRWLRLMISAEFLGRSGDSACGFKTRQVECRYLKIGGFVPFEPVH